MCRGVAPVVGTKGGRFSLLYVDDLADAVASCLRHEADGGQIYELHDGRVGGYAWQDILEAVGELRGGRVFAVRVPAFLVNGIALLNQGVARLTGRPPMLTPGKVRELQHPDWTCDNLAITRDVGWTPQVALADGLHRTLCRAA
jgi:nucleoside-diphosphate-sugar epimerase